jgi:hypothetical protein
VTVIKNQGNFGVKLPNGTLTGALGNLQKKKSDIAMTAFFMKVVKKFFLHKKKGAVHNSQGSFHSIYRGNSS